MDGYETHENDLDDAGATGIVCYGKIQYDYENLPMQQRDIF